MDLTKKGLLLGTSLLAGLAMAGGAWAQAAKPTTAAAATDIGELVVTGSRIPRPNLEQPTPVAVLSTQAIENAGPQNLGDIITELPSVGFGGTVRANSNNFGGGAGAGIAAIDLRNLGIARTLVLVDGQRHVAGDIFTNAVDINSIPPALVDHVEVVTGGASAIYGSDAVSGVVNIILKKRFEGFQFDAQYGADDGYGAKRSASLTAGRSFLDDRLNLTVTGFYSKQDAVEANQLKNAHNYGTITNPNDLSGPLEATFYSSPNARKNDGIPDSLSVPNIGSDLVTPNSVLLNAATFAPQFSFGPNGEVVPVPRRTGFNSFAFAQLPANCPDCYFGDDFTQLASPLETKGADFRANMDFTAHLRGFLDAKFVQSDVSNTIQPSFSFGDFQLQPDNAFTPAAVRTALAGTAAIDFPVISKFTNAGRTEDIRRRTYRVVAGLGGDFDAAFANVRWDAALNYGETDSRLLNNDLTITQNFDAALDSVIDPATGKAACRINVASAPQTGFGAGALNKASCLPYNPFGLPQNVNSAAALAYSFGSFATDDTLTQEVASLNANFDTARFFNLQGGPAGVAVGAEYRREHTKETNDAFLLAGNTENLATNSAGGYHVSEGYIEVNLPVLKDYAPLLRELTFDAAYRGASYSTVGSVGAYKIEGIYGPTTWLKLRATYSQAIRAPNITEAFLPHSSTFFNITDPCSAENIQNNVNFAKNCATAGLPTPFVANTNASITGTTGGNPKLDAERSMSYTGGLVFQPPIIPNLAITLDYYAIKIKEAITQVNAQDIINNCFGSAAGLDPTFCSLLKRGADQNIDFVATTFLNASKSETDGYELHVTYSTDVTPLTQRWSLTQRLDGRLSFDLDADFVAHLRVFPFQSDPTNVHILEGVVENNGFSNALLGGGTPHVKGLTSLTYAQGLLTLGWQVRYVGKGALFNRDPDQADHSESLSVPFAEATFYHNLTARYRFGGALQGAEVFGGVNNVFGEEPPAVTIGTGQDLAYDLGRFFFMGVKFRH